MCEILCKNFRCPIFIPMNWENVGGVAIFEFDNFHYVTFHREGFGPTSSNPYQHTSTSRMYFFRCFDMILDAYKVNLQKYVSAQDIMETLRRFKICNILCSVVFIVKIFYCSLWYCNTETIEIAHGRVFLVIFLSAEGSARNERC